MAKTNGAKKTKPIDAEVLPAEVALVQQEHALVRPWLDNLADWWRSSRRMADEAKLTLQRARARQAPQDEANDLALQDDLLAIRRDIKLAEEHAEPFTGALFKMHRRLTQARAEVIKPLEESAAALQFLHNTYTAEQRRLAREREEKLLRQAEEDARRRQQEELAELERQAVAREEASTDLSDRERRFVEQMARTGNGVQAATNAGFKDPLKTAARLMSLGKITSAINGLKDAEAIRRQALAVSQEPAIPFVNTPAVRAAISKASGARERTTWSADITDLDALHQAALRGEVPPDVLMVDVQRVRRYAEELHEMVNAWPGVVARKTTTTY
jgi:hypothetical protein